MAGEDGGDPGDDWIDVEILQGMDQVEEAVGKLHDFRWRKLGAADSAGTGIVDVTADGGEWSDCGEGIEDGVAAYVAGVEDVIYAGKVGEDFGAEEAVGVGEDGQEHEDSMNLCQAGMSCMGSFRERCEGRGSLEGHRRGS